MRQILPLSIIVWQGSRVLMQISKQFSSNVLLLVITIKTTKTFTSQFNLEEQEAWKVKNPDRDQTRAVGAVKKQEIMRAECWGPDLLLEPV